MADWITNFVEDAGYLAIALLMFLENVFPPIPSELIMPLGGFAAARGDLTFWGVCLAGMVGSVIGQLPLYYLGRVWGEARLRRMADRHGRWLLIDASDIDRASQWFERHGARAVFLCRFVPGVRSLISIPAGMRRMPLVPFLGWSALGMGLWATALAAAGRMLGANYEAVENYVGPVTYVVIGLIVVAIIVRAWRKRRQSRSSIAGASR